MFSSDETSTRPGERGALLLEYAAILTFIVLVALVSLAALGVSVLELYTDNLENLGRAVSRNL